ncbi:MAG: L-threonylcarbamoyladenylate synthase [Nitrospira sp.]|nr:L-threonylcarbamoyladenylate synthase [Nitrospira sp.]MDH4243328.1 L-threonylcarbamoyladenylate synthase [Nitrospira sp.]MDH4356339.1 L-threonylcarbamoyladenylate synthase [Nitrospira sp.]MDH5319697.1 L-threonylcarbamoyladenylate synthase [Nitrospira sp.]
MGEENYPPKGTVLSATDSVSIRLAGSIIRTGGLVAFPTETVYGLGCDAMNPVAAAKVFEAKQRPQFDPLIVHIADRSQLDAVVTSQPPLAQKLMDAFWPGPLTIILPKQSVIPDLVTAGLPTVAVRMPSHPVAQALIREAGTPIAAPSANPFGYVSPTTAQHVSDGLGSKVDLILDGGPCSVGVESTVVSLIDTQPELLRPGNITLEQLTAIIGPVRCGASDHDQPIAPGQLTRHYATLTPLTMLTSAGTQAVPTSDERAGLLLISQSNVNADRFTAVEVLSPNGDLREAARNLFAALRRLDALHLDRIYAEPCKEVGLGMAIMDRLRRCATSLPPAQRGTSNPHRLAAP